MLLTHSRRGNKSKGIKRIIQDKEGVNKSQYGGGEKGVTKKEDISMGLEKRRIIQKLLFSLCRRDHGVSKALNLYSIFCNSLLVELSLSTFPQHNIIE